MTRGHWQFWLSVLATIFMGLLTITEPTSWLRVFYAIATFCWMQNAAYFWRRMR